MSISHPISLANALDVIHHPRYGLVRRVGFASIVENRANIVKLHFDTLPHILRFLDDGRIVRVAQNKVNAQG